MGGVDTKTTCSNCSQFKLVADMLQAIMSSQSDFIKRTDDKLDAMQGELNGFKAFWLPTAEDPENGIFTLLRKVNERQDDMEEDIIDLKTAVDRIEKKTFLGVVATITSTSGKFIKDAGVVIAAVTAMVGWLYAKARGWLQ